MLSKQSFFNVYFDPLKCGTTGQGFTGDKMLTKIKCAILKLISHSYLSKIFFWLNNNSMLVICAKYQYLILYVKFFVSNQSLRCATILQVTVLTSQVHASV